MNNFSLRSLRVLVTVSEKRSISRAALELGRSQASVSSTIAELEDTLGTPLFIRVPAKGLVPTVAGSLIALEARGLLAHADEFEIAAGAFGNAITGDLRVGCFTNLAPIMFANLVAGLEARFPGLHVHMQIGNQEDLLRNLRDGSSELALTFDLDLLDEFHAVELAVLPPRALLPASHALASRSAVSLTELKEEKFILMDLPHTRDYFLSLFYACKLEPKIGHRSSSFELVRTLVGNGLGYSVLNLEPKTSTTYDGTQVVSVPLSDNVRPLRMVLLSMRRIARRRIASTFHDYACDYVKSWMVPDNAP